MKIFVLYNGRSIPWQIGEDQTVEQLKVTRDMYLDSTFILVSYLEVSSLCVSPARNVDQMRYTIKQFTSEVAMSKLQNHDFFYLSI